MPEKETQEQILLRHDSYSDEYLKEHEGYSAQRIIWLREDAQKIRKRYSAKATLARISHSLEA